MSDLAIERMTSSTIIPNSAPPVGKLQGRTIQVGFPAEKESQVALERLKGPSSEPPSLLTRTVLSAITDEFDEEALDELFETAERLFGPDHFEDTSEHIILCRAWYKKAWDWSKEKAKR